MSPRATPDRTRDQLRPYSMRETDLRLDEILDALARATRSTGSGRFRLLAPADLVRCLAPILSRN